MSKIRVLLVDDEQEFRSSASRVLSRRGIEVEEAASGEEALEKVAVRPPGVVVLDLKMPGIGGIETLRRLRESHSNLPVVILSGHGDLSAVMAGISLDIVDFINKPVDLDALAGKLEALFKRAAADRPMRESGISELMVPVERYHRVYLDEPVLVAVRALWESFFGDPLSAGVGKQTRSILVFDRNERFVGLIRLPNLLKLVIPPFLEDSPYSSYFTGMFMAQCKLIAKRSTAELIESTESVEWDAPLIEAVHLMAKSNLMNIPVLKEGKLVGILRERDIIEEIARCVL